MVSIYLNIQGILLILGMVIRYLLLVGEKEYYLAYRDEKITFLQVLIFFAVWGWIVGFMLPLWMYSWIEKILKNKG